MQLTPYTSVDGLPFTATREDVIRQHGFPHSEVRNEVGLTALDLAFVPGDSFWVTALAAHCIGQWEDLRPA